MNPEASRNWLMENRGCVFGTFLNGLGANGNSLRSARARRPAYTLLVFSTPDLSLLLYWGTGPRDPIRGPRAPRAPSAPLGGYSEAIPNGRFTVPGGYYESKLLRYESRSKWFMEVRVLKQVSALEHARACKRVGACRRLFCSHSREVGISRRLPEAVL